MLSLRYSRPQRVLYAVLTCRIVLHLKASMANNNFETLGNSAQGSAPKLGVQSRSLGQDTMAVSADYEMSVFGTTASAKDDSRNGNNCNV